MSRPPSPRAPSVRTRVAQIVSEMAEGSWRASRAQELAELWGCAPSTVRTASAEASRVCRAALGDAEQIRTTLLLQLQVAIDLAKQDPSPAHASRAISIAVSEFARISGVTGPRRLEVTGKDGAPLIKLPPEIEALADDAEALRAFLLGAPPSKPSVAH